MMRAGLFASVLALSAIAFGAEAQALDLPRVVSLDYCADQYVLGLADRSQILAVSVQAGDAHSALRARAEGLPRIKDAAEDVLALNPDLIVRSYGGDARARAYYQSLGLEVFDLGFARSLDDVEAIIARAAQALGHPQRGAERIEALRSDMARARDAGPALSTLYLTPSGTTAGRNTLIHDWLVAAGLENAGAERSGWTSLPLERVIEEAPDLILTAFFDGTAARDSWSPSRHPAFQRILEASERVDLNGADMACASWRLGAAALAARGLERAP